MIERKQVGRLEEGRITERGDVVSDKYIRSPDIDEAYIKIPPNCLSVRLEYMGTGLQANYVQASIWAYNFAIGGFIYKKNSGYTSHDNPEAPHFYVELTGNKNDFGTHLRCCFKNFYDVAPKLEWDVLYPTFVFDRGNVWFVENGKLNCENLVPDINEDLSFMEEPYPPFLWYVDEDANDLNASFLPESISLGAFADCTNLRRVIIPPSVKYIGEYAFANTALTTVKIARDCTFFPTSFPPRCIIQYYDT